MSLESFRAELLAQNTAANTDNMAQPNRYCWLESSTNWYKVSIRQPSIIVATGTPGTVIYAFGPGMPIDADRVNLETYPMRNGFGFFFAPGDWWVNLQLAGSVAATQCFVVKSIRENEVAQLIAGLSGVDTDAVDVVKWGGAAVTGAGAVGGGSSGESAIAPVVRATVTGLDSTQGAGSQIQNIGSRGNSAAQLASIQRLLVDATTRSYDVINTAHEVVGGLEETSSSSVLGGYVLEMRKSGYVSSRRGRRYTVKSPNITGVAAATALTTTAPTFLLVNGATNEAVIRRIKISMPVVGTSTSLQLLVKTDTADRFSSGGTTRTPATMNNGNVVAATQARSLEAPTATAEGGGTRDIDVQTGLVQSGGTIIYEPEDGLIIAASGSLLIYVITATAGATIHYVIEYEDVNVQ